jgi:hypothetical protein
VADYIENFYSVRRRHSLLDCQSPVEFELKHKAHRRDGGSAPIPAVGITGAWMQESPVYPA